MAKNPSQTPKNGGPQAEGPGARLQQALDELGITQAEVARRTSAPASYLNDVIRGRRTLTEGFAATIQHEFGIDKLWLRYGEGQMFRRLPPQPSLPSAAAMTSLPLLDRPCHGNPLDSGAWAGSTHPVPRGQALPLAPDRHRYVLRVSGHGATGELRDGDLIVVETLPANMSPDPDDCWVVVMDENVIRIRRLGRSEPPGGQVWGWCVGIVWRRLPAPG